MAAILADNIFKCIFFNDSVWISLKISLRFVPKVPIDSIPALVQIMAWRRSDDKPLSEQMMVSLLTHICVTRPQWVNPLWPSDNIWHHGAESTLVQVMACCLMAPSRYLNQCWPLISRDLHHSPKGKTLKILMKVISNQCNTFENCTNLLAI